MEGLEVVGAYMTDPLWIAEYTLYLEQNFCVGHPDRCVEVVKVFQLYQMIIYTPIMFYLETLPSHACHGDRTVLEAN